MSQAAPPTQRPTPVGSVSVWLPVLGGSGLLAGQRIMVALVPDGWDPAWLAVVVVAISAACTALGLLVPVIRQHFSWVNLATSVLVTVYYLTLVIQNHVHELYSMVFIIVVAATLSVQSGPREMNVYGTVSSVAVAAAVTQVTPERLTSMLLLLVGTVFAGLFVYATARSRHEAVARAQQREAELRALFDSMGEGIVVHTRDGKMLHHNSAATRLLDRTPTQLENTTPENLLQHVLPSGQASPTVNALREGVPTGPVAWDTISENAPHSVEASAVPYRDAGNQVLGVLTLLRDVTPRRLLEQQVRMADRLSSLGTLAAGVAHEINNPLAYIIGNIQYALEVLAPNATVGAEAREELPDALREALQGAERVRRIVADLSTFTRQPEDGAVSLVDVNRAVAAALSLTSHQLKHRCNVLRKEEPVPHILAHEGRLVQVLVNLLINAAQAMPLGEVHKHAVEVTTRLGADGQVHIIIRDDGCGIPAAVLHRVFDPFFTTKTVGEGTGLGLAICHSLVTQMGGDIRLESMENVGTTVTLRLPPARALQPSQQPLAQPARNARRRLLVVDDDPMVVRAMGRALGVHHDVRTTTSAVEALGLIKQDAGAFDAVVCDVMMPEMTGMEFHRQLCVRAPALSRRLVFLTGGAFSAEAREYLERVALPVVEKPYREETLEAAVAQVTGTTAETTAPAL